MNEPKRSTGWTIAVALFSVALLGASAALLIPAFAGLDPSDDPATKVAGPLGPILWAGLLGMSIRKRKGLSGGVGFGVGALIGIFIVMFSGFVLGYQKASARNAASMEQVDKYIKQANAELPTMVNDGLRADRIGKLATTTATTQSDLRQNNKRIAMYWMVNLGVGIRRARAKI